MAHMQTRHTRMPCELGSSGTESDRQFSAISHWAHRTILCYRPQVVTSNTYIRLPTDNTSHGGWLV